MFYRSDYSADDDMIDILNGIDDLLSKDSLQRQHQQHQQHQQSRNVKLQKSRSKSILGFNKEEIQQLNKRKGS